MAKTTKPGSKVKARVNQVGAKRSASTETRSSKQSEKNASGGSRDQVVVRDLETADNDSYLRLRQSLDSFQAVALYYYGSGENTQQRIDRADEIKKYLQSFTRQDSILQKPDIQCPAGTRPCSGGDCVPVFISCKAVDGESPE